MTRILSASWTGNGSPFKSACRIEGAVDVLKSATQHASSLPRRNRRRAQPRGPCALPPRHRPSAVLGLSPATAWHTLCWKMLLSDAETISIWQKETARHLPVTPEGEVKFDFAAGTFSSTVETRNTFLIAVSAPWLAPGWKKWQAHTRALKYAAIDSFAHELITTPISPAIPAPARDRSDSRMPIAEMRLQPVRARQLDYPRLESEPKSKPRRGLAERSRRFESLTDRKTWNEEQTVPMLFAGRLSFD